jgi:hydrogenase nickel incorporation protein HypA/HybF
MHELGYCEALLPVVAKRADGRAVDRVGVTAGVRHKLVADVMQMAWQMTASGTPYAEATIVLDEIPITAVCRDCGHQFSTVDSLAECPSCQALGPELEGGDEIALGWLQYAGSAPSDREVADASVSGPSADDQHDHIDDHADVVHHHQPKGD